MKIIKLNIIFDINNKYLKLAQIFYKKVLYFFLKDKNIDFIIYFILWLIPIKQDHILKKTS